MDRGDEDLVAVLMLDWNITIAQGNHLVFYAREIIPRNIIKCILSSGSCLFR